MFLELCCQMLDNAVHPRRQALDHALSFVGVKHRSNWPLSARITSLALEQCKSTFVIRIQQQIWYNSNKTKHNNIVTIAYGPLTLTRYAKLRVAHAPGTFPRHRFQRKSLVNDPGMHHGTCVTHVARCMSGSLTHGGRGNVLGIPGACAPRNSAYLVRGSWDILYGCVRSHL